MKIDTLPKVVGEWEGEQVGGCISSVMDFIALGEEIKI
jgi:hypothetical protein